MLKRTYETEETEAKFWINKETGALNIDIDSGIGEIPNEEAIQIIHELQKDLMDYYDKKESFWTKYFGR